MAEDHIRYDILTQDALRGVVRKVLMEVEKTGLPGEHHIYISFDTKAAGVRISERLLEQYPSEMNIVLQNQFWNLSVKETGFEVGLSFDGINETLSVPFSAMKGFYDPSVQFGLQFDTQAVQDDEAEPEDPIVLHQPDETDDISASATSEPNDDDDAAPEGDEGEKVVSLDAFRKKP